MFCCSVESDNKLDEKQKEDRQRESKNNTLINQELNLSMKEDKQLVKVLLLGSGESGKSTLFKQMKILHQDGFGHEDKIFYRRIIYDNLYEIVRSLAIGCQAREIKLESEGNKGLAERVIASGLACDVQKNAVLFQALKVLCSDSGILQALRRSSELRIHLPDSALYFFAHLHRVFEQDYIPTNVDILRSRVATSGVIHSKFAYRQATFALFDVGGQRSERKKWIRCFENVTAILFIASLSEYDQTMKEDEVRNRLDDSLALFEAIVNLPWFKDISIILFLNKEDLFREKIKSIDLGTFIPSYHGGCNYENALNFIQGEYLRRVHNKNKKVFVHVTQATNTKNIVFVWKDVTKILISNRLMKLGLLRPTDEPVEVGDPPNLGAQMQNGILGVAPSAKQEIDPNDPDPLDRFID